MAPLQSPEQARDGGDRALEPPGGCEDTRVVEGGGTYYMTYTGYDGVSARLCLATLRDLPVATLVAHLDEVDPAWRSSAKVWDGVRGGIDDAVRS
jgi:hypothetical protein